MNYTVTANGGTVVVSDDSEVVSYTSPSLIYGDVLVTAVNSCGQESLPASLFINYGIYSHDCIAVGAINFCVLYSMYRSATTC